MELLKHSRVMAAIAQEFGRDCHSWCVENPDLDAQYEFYLFVLVQRQSEDMCIVCEWIPLSNGDLIKKLTTGVYETVMNSCGIKMLQSSQTIGGVIQLSKLKMLELYFEISQLSFNMIYEIIRYNARGEEVETIKTTKYTFPAFPLFEVPNPTDLINTRGGLRICFSDVEVLPDGDYEIGGGLEGDLPFERGKSRIYFELSEQGGSPAHIVQIWILVLPDGNRRFLCGDMCTSQSYEVIRNHIFCKQKKSWFKKKTRMTHMRAVFRVAGVAYQKL